MALKSINLVAAEIKLAALERAQARLRDAQNELQRTLHTPHPEVAISIAIEALGSQCSGYRALIGRIKAIGR